MKWHWHHWKIAHKEAVDGGCWFVHKQCSCGKEKIESHIGFFASINNSIELGIAMGVYKGLYPLRTGKKLSTEG